DGRNALAGFVEERPGASSNVMDARRIAIDLAEERQHHLADLRIKWRGGVVVEIDRRHRTQHDRGIVPVTQAGLSACRPVGFSYFCAGCLRQPTFSISANPSTPESSRAANTRGMPLRRSRNTSRPTQSRVAKAASTVRRTSAQASLSAKGR